MKIFLAFLLTVNLLALTSCGGGGGSDDNFAGAATISMSVSPSKIDTDDRTRVTIELDDINENGIALKIFFPLALEYVQGSAYLTVGDLKTAINPLYNVISDDDDGTYLVFFLAENDFDPNNSGKVQFELAGIDELEDGILQADADVDDPLIPNNLEFSVDDPAFSSEEEKSITVVSS